MNISQKLQRFIDTTKMISEHTRRFSGGLDGLGFSEFMILLQLKQSPEQKMRRTDLAECVGLTASGVTRLLAPMEKIGLIKREAAPRDARVSYVVITKSGERNLEESLQRAEEMASDVFAD